MSPPDSEGVGNGHPASPPVALSAHALTVRYGEGVALEAVELEVPSGRSVAVLGPNGAGKSTLFAAALGLVDTASGSIDVRVRRTALVPQRTALEPRFPVTVSDVVWMGRYGELGLLGRPREEDRRLVAAAMEALGIAGLAGRRLFELSGGERQRALLAQAMAQNAELILLDEPMSGVDAPTQAVVQSLIGRWRDEGRTVLVATHDLRSASRDYDLVLCLNRTVVAFGTPAEVCVEPVLAETFSGRVVRVGDSMIDIAHHHHGAG